MTPQEILSHPAQFITDEQRAQFFEEGYLCLKGLATGSVLTRMQLASERLVDESRHITGSRDDYVLSDGHSASSPRLRRIYRVTDHDPAFWDFASQSALVDVVSDLVGPDVKFREAYINFKWAGGGDAVAWHQDLPFLPHTNRAVITTLTYLSDVTEEMGPFMVVPRSQKGELFEHYDKAGRWTGRIASADLERVALDTSVSFVGPAGTVIFMDSSAVHGSLPNFSSHNRPVLISGYAAADAIAYTRTPASQTAAQTGAIVRGQPARYAHHEPMRMRMPPDWSESYTSIFEDQQGQVRSAAVAA